MIFSVTPDSSSSDTMEDISRSVDLINYFLEKTLNDFFNSLEDKEQKHEIRCVKCLNVIVNICDAFETIKQSVLNTRISSLIAHLIQEKFNIISTILEQGVSILFTGKEYMKSAHYSLILTIRSLLNDMIYEL